MAWFQSPAAAKQSALTEVQRILSGSENSKLDRIQQLKATFEKKKLAVETQLSAAVQTQVEESRKGMDLLQKSINSVKEMRSNFDDIDRVWQDINTMLLGYDNFRRIFMARRNLRATLAQLEEYNQIPKKAAEIAEAMKNNAKLEEVWKDVRRLEKLRESVLRESRDVSSSVLNVMGKHFECVITLSEDFRRHLWDILAHAIQFAKSEPETLVRVLKILEMEDRAAQRVRERTTRAAVKKERVTRTRVVRKKKEKPKSDKKKKNKKKKKGKYESSSGSSEEEIIEEDVDPEDEEEDDDALLLPDKMSEACDVIRRTINAQFETRLDGKATNGEDLPHILAHLSQMLEDLTVIQEDVIQCFPPRYNIFELYKEEYQQGITQALLPFLSPFMPLKPGDLLLLAAWTEEYHYHLTRLGIDTETDTLALAVKKKMPEFMKHIESLLGEWVMNLLRVELAGEVDHTPEGHCITHGPEDLFMFTHQQVNVASEKLRGQYLIDVFTACCNALFNYQKQQLSVLSDVGSIDPELICAVVNNHNRASKLTNELRDRCLKLVHVSLEPKTNEMFQAVSKSFITVSRQAVSVLVERIMVDLSPELNSIWTERWVRPDSNVIGDVITTAEDYFKDCQKWLSLAYFFTKLVKELAERLVNYYLERLVENAKVASGSTKDPLALTPANVDKYVSRMEEDDLALRSWFQKYPSIIRTEFAEQILNRLQMISVWLTTPPVNITDCFDTVWDVWEQRTVPVAEAIFKLRTDIDKKLEREALVQLKLKQPPPSTEDPLLRNVDR
eukprot:GILK01009008.1.p1 GENE.GILK01009008.1~~GILK01009008.1.p1  ORF type:complete len:786 (-),score=190.69 GILK01009008.1:548-2905(-)